MRDISYLKPEGYEYHRTIAEVAKIVNRDPARIRILEAQGRIPQAIRVKCGDIYVRLWSPSQVIKIAIVFNNLRPGRPKKVR